ncbi:hypothetical protein ACPOL_7184 (plasmid) [Acidisarcina polymorpha]|uniref:Uncharacterized protein n=1 Tax=Acidisarcina polymorpha TaxID=2211140 RepID=A0A2Z5GCC1_9BACT|nr:hypothetical protein ACPOL_7184 [Acidisarcina polymorpha]
MSPLVNKVMKGLKPREAIRVVEGHPITHLRSIGWRNGNRSVRELPTKFSSQQSTHSRLSSAANTHQNQNHGKSFLKK